jgi:hypothetical protein
MSAASVRRKLHAWELLHLREWCAQLEAENERLREELYDAHSRADMFHDALLQVEDVQLGLTQDGQIKVTR